MNMQAEKQRIIEDYIDAYNNFDVEKMLQNLHTNVEFRNISDGEINLTTNGIDEFAAQAEKAKNIFSKRQQKIIDFRFEGDDRVETNVDYEGILAIDLPNGLKKDSKIELKGKSIFRFSGDKIIEIEDIS